jgi:exopolyphosphatase/guanosine-5'-triphosphate,3'-diphosphate pyrophosphatase
MSAIVPRWEWRTFGAPQAAEADLEARAAGAPEESEELYLLSAADGNVKVRDGLMDVKVLREVDADGLERWEPVMKARFPLPAADARRVLDVLGLSTAVLDRDAYTLEEFLAELEGSTSVRPVRIRKRRTRLPLGGCMAEVADVSAEGRAARTVAVESPDPDAVIASVRDVGLGGYLNTSYPRGLTDLLEGVPARYAVIDVGTNSVKFHLGERGSDGRWRTLVDRAEVTRLGEDLQRNGIISPEPLARTVDAIAGMVEEARRDRARAIAAVGTAGLRAAGNREDVIEAVRARTGVTVEVIPGEEESRLAYLAVRGGLGSIDGSLVVFDTGGGSTQFTFGRGPAVQERFSLEVGAVRYTERFGLDDAVGPEVLREALAAISGDLGRIEGRSPPDALVAMGGAVTNLVAVKLALPTYDPDLVQGAVLDRSEVDRQIELYRTRDSAARRELVGLQPARAPVILAGACIVRTIMDMLGQEALTVSDRGLRHGLLVERFGA